MFIGNGAKNQNNEVHFHLLALIRNEPIHFWFNFKTGR